MVRNSLKLQKDEDGITKRVLSAARAQYPDRLTNCWSLVFPQETDETLDARCNLRYIMGITRLTSHEPGPRGTHYLFKFLPRADGMQSFSPLVIMYFVYYVLRYFALKPIQIQIRSHIFNLGFYFLGKKLN